MPAADVLFFVTLAAAFGIAVNILGVIALRQDVRRQKAAWLTICLGLSITVAAGAAIIALPPRWNEVVDAAGAGSFALSLAGGGLLVFYALRGRRVGDHEHCRRCGFDLSGRSPGTRVCGECGASLDRRRAIVVGERRRRPVMLACGAVLLCFAARMIAPTAPALLSMLREHNWQQYRSESSLVASLRDASPAAVARAITGLEGRHRDERLSPAGEAAFIDALIERGGRDRSPTRWDVGFATRVAAYDWQIGKLDEAIVRRAMAANLDLRLAAAPETERGGPLRYWIASPENAVGGLSLSFANRADTLSGRPLGPPRSSTLMSDPGADDGIDVLGNALDVSSDAPLGPATFEVRLTATATLATPSRPTLVERRDVTLSATTTIVPAGAKRCPLALDARGVRKVKADVRAEVVAPTPRYGDEGGPGRWFLRLYSPGRDPWIGDVAIRMPDGREQMLGGAYVDGTTAAWLPLAPMPPAPFDVVLRGRPELGAERFVPGPTADMSLTWISSAVGQVSPGAMFAAPPPPLPRTAP